MLARAVLWGPVGAWMAVIFCVSQMSFPPGGRLLPDWEMHGIVYGILAALLGRALAGGIRRAPLGTLVFAASLATAYGVTDEWHQMYVRHGGSEVGDVVNDMMGAAIGAAGLGGLAGLRPVGA